MGRLIFLVIVSVFLSCSTNKVEENSSLAGIQIHFKENLTLQIDSISSSLLYYFDHGYYEDKEVLYVLNSVNNSVDIYSLETGVVIKRHSLGEDGRFPIANPQGILFHSVDSIFVFPAMLLSSIVLLDSESGAYHGMRVKLKSENPIDRVINHASLPSMKTHVLENSLLFTNLTLGSPMVSSDFFDTYKPQFSVNITTDSLTWVSKITYPNFYRERFWPESFVSLSTAKNHSNELIYSWAASDSLIVLDSKHQKLKTVLAKSIYSKPTLFGNEPISESDKWKLNVTNLSYIQILYDSFREVFYRIVLLPREVEDHEYLDHTSTYLNDFSVMVFDKDFKFLGETKFSGGVYHPYLAFVGKKGLYISRGNPYNPENNEDSLTFDVFVHEN